MTVWRIVFSDAVRNCVIRAPVTQALFEAGALAAPRAYPGTHTYCASALFAIVDWARRCDPGWGASYHDALAAVDAIFRFADDPSLLVRLQGGDKGTILHYLADICERRKIDATGLACSVARHCCAAGADVSHKDLAGRTPLHRVLASPYSSAPYDMVVVLMDAGADAEARDNHGWTALELTFARAGGPANAWKWFGQAWLGRVFGVMYPVPLHGTELPDTR